MKITQRVASLCFCVLLVSNLIIIGAERRSYAFDASLLTPEELPMNKPLEVEPYADPDILKYLAPVRAQFDNQAFTESAPTINPRMTSFASQMRKTIYEPVKDKVFLLTGWQLASTLIVAGEDGLIVVDPGMNDNASAQILKAFRTATGNEFPVKAVIYTHRHPDHIFGTAGLGVTQEQVDKGDVKIYAHHEFMEYLSNDTSIVGEILTARTGFAGGAFIGTNAKGSVHIGLGPPSLPGKISFIAPTDIVKGQLEVKVSGVEMILFDAYGDAEDEIDIYFPRLKHVHGSETIQGETFPNLYTLRGTKYRDLVKWYKGVDKLLAFARQSETYSHSHMRAWVGNEFIVERIQNYRDAIQYVHDQAIRHINRGATREELAGLIILPEKLRNDPWLQEFYGSVANVVRNVYNGYLGWFSGDATELAAPAFYRKARLYVSAMGGRDNVLAIARQAIDKKDYGWAMEVLTHVIRSNPEDKEARGLKAEAMRSWGYEQANIYNRNFALSGALELDGNIPRLSELNFGNPTVIKQLGVGTILENLRVKIDAEKSIDADLKIGFNITDKKESYGYHVRNGIAVFYNYIPENPALVLNIPSSVVYDFALGKGSIKKAIESGLGTSDGDLDNLEKFMTYLDYTKTDINLSSR